MQRNWLGTDRLAVVRDDFEQHQVTHHMLFQPANLADGKVRGSCLQPAELQSSHCAINNVQQIHACMKTAWLS